MGAEVVVANKCCDNEFYEKITILVVDDDITSLLITSALLKKERHKVVTVKNAEDALRILRLSGNTFDLVITDVHMPEINGFQFQQQIIKKIDIPVAFMSADVKESTVTKGLESGGVCFILKPISQDDIRDLWQYATRRKKKMNIGKSVIEIQENTNERSPDEVIVVDSSSLVNEESNKKGKSGRKHERDENQDNLSTASKKSKLVWTDFLHNRFLEAVTKLGLAKAYPRRILALMDIPELTKGNVASHLQKYRHYLKKVTTPVNSSPQFISNSSEITLDDVNQLYTRKASNNVSTHQLLNAAATSGQQLMIGNLNDVSDAEIDYQGTDQKKKEFADMLAFHINQKHHNIKFGNMKSANLSTGDITLEASMELPPLPENFVSTGVGAEGSDTTLNHFSLLDNSYPTPNSTVHITSVFDSQLEVQSSNMVNNNIEEGTNLSFIDGNNDKYQQVCLSWTDHILAEQKNYEGVIAEEKSFQFCNTFLNSELEQENYGDITTKDIPFQFLNAPLNSELEQTNYGGNTVEERPFLLHHVPPNPNLEQGQYGGITTEENAFHLHYVSPESEI